MLSISVLPASTLSLALFTLSLLAFLALLFRFLTALAFHRIVIHGFPLKGEHLQLEFRLYGRRGKPAIREIPVLRRIAP